MRPTRQSSQTLMGAVLLVALGTLPATAQPAGDEQRPLTQEELALEGKRQLRDQYYQNRRKPRDEAATFIPAQARLNAILEARSRQASTARGGIADLTQWSNIGPAPTTNGQTPTSNPRFPSDVSGRVSAIAVAPSAGTVYIGGAQGGIWKTDDDGATWTAIAQDLETLAVGSIELDPNNEDTIYLGTGEGNGSCDSYGGVGVYKSTDGGDSWTGPFGGSLFGLNRSVATIEVDRTNSDVVLLGSASGVSGISCTVGPTFPARGIFRSTDGGANWTKVTTGNFRISKIIQDPATDTTFWAAAWRTGPTVDNFNGGLLRSTDSGVTWTQIAGTGGLPALDDSWARSWITGTVAVSAAGPPESVLYVANGQASGSVWRSDDSGATWTQRPAATGYCAGQCSYDMPIYVEPGDPDTLYTGGAGTSNLGVLPSQMMRSSDGGATFTDIVRSADMSTAMHADVHAITTIPGSDNHVWVGNDGGMWRSTDRGTNWININSNLAITQFSGCDLDPTDPDRAYGGTQDNGTMGWTGIDAWPHLDFGDGGFARIDQTNPDNLVHTYFNLTNVLIGVGWTTNGFATTQGNYNFSAAPGNGISLADRVLFYAPIHLDHGVTDTLYFGTQELYRAPNFFASGTGFAPLAGGADLTGGTGALSAIETFSPTPGVLSTLIYTGSSDGVISRSTNGGTSFTAVDSPGIFVSDVVVDRTNTMNVYASLAGFSGAPGLNVRRSTDGGTTWASAGTGLPDIPVNALVQDPLNSSRIWAGTDIGVFVSEDSAQTWVMASEGMPRVAVFDLKARDNGRMIACTHGRSVFATDLNLLPLFADGFEQGNTAAWSFVFP
ncbi:MAG: hypothetical protein AAGD06_08085 [Acidobacteriota bacterium]